MQEQGFDSRSDGALSQLQFTDVLLVDEDCSLLVEIYRLAQPSGLVDPSCFEQFRSRIDQT